MTKLSSLSIALAMASPGVAAADEADLAAASPFVTLARHDVTSHLDLDAGYMFPKDDDGTLLRLHLFGEYVHPSGFGVYATVPFTHVSGDGESSDQLGGFELGGIFVPKLESSHASLIIHAGVALPSVTDNSVEGLINFGSAFMRVTDLYAQFPKSTTFRLGVSPTIHSGALFARADVSVDLNLASPNDANIRPGFELGLGVGAHLDKATLTAEVSNLTITGIGDSSDGGSLDTVAVSAQYDAGRLTPYAAVIMGLDDDVRDVMSAAIVLGVRSHP